MREYPAYGRTIAAHLARGEKPLAVGVVLSNRWWSLLDHVPKVCIRTDDWEPGRYEFGYLHDMHVVAYFGDCEEQQFGELLIEIMLVAPSLLWAFEISGAPLSADVPGSELTMAEWAGSLTKRAYHRDPQLKTARSRYAQGLQNAARRELEEFERIRGRSGDEAAVRWHAARMGWADLVRKRFGAPAPLEASAQPA